VLNVLTFKENRTKIRKKIKEKIFKWGYYGLFTSYPKGVGVFVIIYNKQKVYQISFYKIVSRVEQYKQSNPPFPYSLYINTFTLHIYTIYKYTCACMLIHLSVK
jgi:hypothetical protein